LRSALHPRPVRLWLQLRLPSSSGSESKQRDGLTHLSGPPESRARRYPHPRCGAARRTRRHRVLERLTSFPNTRCSVEPCTKHLSRVARRRDVGTGGREDLLRPRNRSVPSCRPIQRGGLGRLRPSRPVICGLGGGAELHTRIRNGMGAGGDVQSRKADAGR
jgi:hypothetical protein